MLYSHEEDAVEYIFISTVQRSCEVLFSLCIKYLSVQHQSTFTVLYFDHLLAKCSDEVELNYCMYDPFKEMFRYIQLKVIPPGVMLKGG